MNAVRKFERESFLSNGVKRKNAQEEARIHKINEGGKSERHNYD